MEKSIIAFNLIHYSIAIAVSFIYFDMKKKGRFGTKLKERILFFCMLFAWLLVAVMTAAQLVFV